MYAFKKETLKVIHVRLTLSYNIAVWILSCLSLFLREYNGWHTGQWSTS